MNQSKALLAVVCCAAVVSIGCASRPSALDAFASSAANSNAVASEVVAQNEDFVSTRHSAQAVSTPPYEIGRLEQQLQSNVAADRIAACEELGRIAARNEGELGPIEMLASVLKLDDSMEVRMAATDALGALNRDRADDQLSNMIPTEELPAAPKERLSLLQRFWR